MAALITSIIPALPGLAYNVTPEVDIGGAIYISQFNWYYGIVVSSVVYATLSLIWPATETLVPCMIDSIDDAEIQHDFEKEAAVEITTEKRE